MLKIGLTGNIGSGKTSVAHVFEVLGIPVFYADDESKKLLTDSKVKNQLVKLFGRDILNHSKEVDKQHLASIVFTDKEKLKELNELLHPLVYQSYLNWTEEQKGNYTILEAAILFESGFNNYVHQSICVFAEKRSRIKRIKSRDNINIEDIKNRMNNQWDDERKNKLADYLIDNNENEMIIPQILKIHKVLIAQVDSKKTF